MENAKKIPSLDGLRAVSIVFVVVSHLSRTRGFPNFPFLAHAFFTYGYFGVRIFFVISGFLITSLLLQEKDRTGRISLREFYVRRAYRILPAAYAYMLVVTLFFWHVLPRIDILCAYTYLTNYILHNTWNLGHLWSLSVEEQFYILWPLLMAAYFHKRVQIVVGAIILGPLFRLFVGGLDAAGIAHLSGNVFPSVQDALATGCLLALIRPKVDTWSATIDRWIPWIAALTLVLPPLRIARGVQPLFTETLMNVGIALCIHHCIRKRYRWLNVAPVMWLGTLSYSLYLWQQVFLNYHSMSPLAAFPLNIMCALTMACACHYGVEKPFLRLRDNRTRRRSVSEFAKIGC
jgi:peptidoglycan/LPS O-acetylase OafA/YrhL